MGQKKKCACQNSCSQGVKFRVQSLINWVGLDWKGFECIYGEINVLIKHVLIQFCTDRMTKWISEASQLVDRERECFIGVSVCADDRVMKLSMRDSTRLHIQLIECFKVTPTVWWTEGLCIECGLKQRCTIRENPPIPRSKERFETETGKTPHS